MCGINGILSLGQGEKLRETVSRMNNALAHRGPDAEGMWNDRDVVLGHRRLAIIDLSSAGNQPMSCPDERYTLVYNGEIYNFLQIRKSLNDYPYISHTDSEVILAAFRQLGTNSLKLFNGMFAFAIWDRLDKALFLVRDRTGIKPLYYAITRHAFIFSSELRSVLTTGLVERKISRDALVDYLRYQTVHAPQTIVNGVSMLLPGQWMKVICRKVKGATGFTIEQGTYWSPEYPVGTFSPAGKHAEEIKKDIRHLMHQSVEQRLVADVPFGAFLSGGIDSSVVVGLMSQIQSQPVRTFSVIFEEKKYSEALFSRQIAKRFHTHHHEIFLKPNNLLQMLPHALLAMDHPSGDGLNTWVISKVTKESGITMALSGLGGDELFGGYALFKRLYYLNMFRCVGNIPESWRRRASGMLDMATSSMAILKAKEILSLPKWDIQHTYPIMRQTLPDDNIRKLMSLQNLPNNKVFEILKKHLKVSASQHNSIIGTGWDIYADISYAELTSYLQNVLLRDTDQMSMALALEIRVPFLDYELVEYILQVQSKYKSTAIPKRLLVESMRPMLPEEIFKRKKMGFVFPWDHWMRHELKSFCETKLKRLEILDVFNMPELMKLWSRFLAYDPLVSWSRIWPLVVLSEWVQNNQMEGFL